MKAVKQLMIGITKQFEIVIAKALVQGLQYRAIGYLLLSFFENSRDAFQLFGVIAQNAQLIAIVYVFL